MWLSQSVETIRYNIGCHRFVERLEMYENTMNNRLFHSKKKWKDLKYVMDRDYRQRRSKIQADAIA